MYLKQKHHEACQKHQDFDTKPDRLIPLNGKFSKRTSAVGFLHFIFTNPETISIDRHLVLFAVASTEWIWKRKKIWAFVRRQRSWDAKSCEKQKVFSSSALWILDKLTLFNLFSGRHWRTSYLLIKIFGEFYESKTRSWFSESIFNLKFHCTRKRKTWTFSLFFFFIKL